MTQKDADRTETPSRIHLVVAGLVQGVGFRWFVTNHAKRLGLRGHVWNTASGEVQIEAAGPRDTLDRLRQLVARGPEGARVDAVREIPPGTAELPEDFIVRRHAG